MNIQNILETLALVAGTTGLVTGCPKPDAQTTEVPGGATTKTPEEKECLHAEGCCGGHTPGDASCGDDKASDGSDAAAKADPGAATAWTRTWTIPPGDTAEINLELAAGDTMAAKFSTDGGALAWNVHSHEGKEALIHAKGDDPTGRPAHTAAKAGMYSFLWHNAGKTPVKLTVELELGGSAKVHSTHPAE